MDVTDLSSKTLQNATTIGTTLLAGGAAIAAPSHAGDIAHTAAVITNLQTGAFYGDNLAKDLGAIHALFKPQTAISLPARIFCMALVPLALPACIRRSNFNMQGIGDALKNARSFFSR